VTEKRGRRWKQLLDHFKETSGWWKLKENCIALCGELILEEAVDILHEILQNE
jgi:hypothetical protein